MVLIWSDMRTFTFISGFSLGLSIFLLGLKLLGSSLQSALGNKLRLLLTRLTTTKLRCVFAGMASTCLVQSSSAVASMMVVLVSSGMLTPKQAFGVILGANLGTTLTAQIIAFRIESVALPLIFLGLLIVFAGRRKSLGTVLFALGSLFYGLMMITATLTPLLQFPIIQNILQNLSDTPLEACLTGVILTALIQSSSAVTGVVISLAHLDAISLSAAVGVALGSNVGTVFTTLIASVGRGRASKATAFADFIFNVGGVLLVLPFYGYFLQLVAHTSADIARQIANAHFLFNLLTVILAWPFLDYFAAVAWRLAGIKMGNKKYRN